MAGKIISTNLEGSEKASLAALQKLINSIKELRSREDAGLQRENLGLAQMKLTDGTRAVAAARKGYAEQKKKIKDALAKANADLKKAKSLWESIEESVGKVDKAGSAGVMKLIADAIKEADAAAQATVAS